MRFIVSTSTLLKQLQAVNGASSSSTVLPILENFLFEIKDGSLTISATDLQTSMTTSLPVESKEDGKVAVPSKILLETLKTLPDQPVAFSVDAQTFAIEISAGDGKYKLSGENGEDFPKIPAVENASSVRMPASVLAEAINKTIFAVSNDDLRPAMTGVFCQLSPQNITFVATDAHKLVRYRRNDTKSDAAASFILPKKALTLLKASLGTDDSAVSLEYNSTSAFFRINGSELHISSEDVDFSNEAHVRLGCQYEGEDMEIGFNAKFLIEMLGNLEGDEVTLEMSTPNRAGLLIPQTNNDNENVLMLVMPVMLNNYA